MKITKYPQSCLMVETKNRKILVDPGSLKYEERFADEWKRADVILITHKHSDHIKADILSTLTMPLYSTQEVQLTYPELKFNIVKAGEVLDFDGIKVEVVQAFHGYNPNLRGVAKVLENVGYIIDDGEHRLYVTSDTICFENDYKADVVALPVTAHGLTMSAYEAALLAKDLGAKLVLPTHMDNPLYPTDLEYMYKNFDVNELNYKVLVNGEEIVV